MSSWNLSSLKEFSWFGQEQILPVYGPITRTLDDTVLMTKMIFNSYTNSKQ